MQESRRKGFSSDPIRKDGRKDHIPGDGPKCGIQASAPMVIIDCLNAGSEYDSDLQKPLDITQVKRSGEI